MFEKDKLETLRWGNERNSSLNEEFQADLCRDKREYTGAPNTDAEYDLRKMLDPDYLTYLKLLRLREILDDESHVETTD